jgi:Zn-dependent M28 family amino/carboxypeptidase
MRRLSTLLLIPFAISLAQNPKIPKEALVGYQSISASDLRARLSFIASPELEGRETTFRGQKVAARYIASEFQRIGLKPMGDSGTYFQHFQVEATKIDDKSTITVTTTQGPSTYQIWKDFISTSGSASPVAAPVLFVGYTDTKVDSNLSKGKIIVALAGRKVARRDTSATPRGRTRDVPQFTGSIATLVVADDTGSNSMEGQYARVSARLDARPMRIPGAQPRGGRGPFGPSAYVSPRLANELLKETGKSLSQWRLAAAQDSVFAPISLKQTTVKLDISNTTEIKTTENVLGLLEGSDPKLKDEIVAFTGHYDHLGITGGLVNPGADDDGSGTVTVIELAQAFASNPVKPKRSLLFMTVVGEEKGLLGSEWYVTHPVIPLEKTIADLNTDMIGRVNPIYEELKNPNYVYVIGSDKISTQLDSVLKLSNQQSENLILDYKYNDDTDPNNFYRRSDHYNFAKNGVPIVFFFTGVHADYHKPTDTIEKILFPRMERIVHLIYTTGWHVANAKTGLTKDVQSSMFSK